MIGASYIQFVDSGTTKGYIYLSEDIPFPYNLSVAEIQDISKKNSSFSKELSIPGTKENNILLGHIFDINTIDWTFDLNVKQRCYVYQNGERLFDGFFKLNGVRKISPTAELGDEHVIYNATIFSDDANFFSVLGEKLVESLDLSQYDHILNDNSTVGSSANTFDNGYKYYLPYKNTATYYSTTDLNLCIYAKTITDRIFYDAGYSTEGFFNSELYKKLVIPYNGDIPKLRDEVRAERQFQISISSATNTYQVIGAGTDTYTSKFPTFPVNYSTSIDVPFNDKTTGTNFDSASTYDVSSYTWTPDFNGTIDLEIKFDGTIRYSAATDGWKYEDTVADTSLSAGTEVTITCALVKNVAGISDWVDFISPDHLIDVVTTSIREPQRNNITSSGPDISAGQIYLKYFAINGNIPSVQVEAGVEYTLMLFIHPPDSTYAFKYYNASSNVGNTSDRIAVTSWIMFDTNYGPENRLKNFVHINSLTNGDTVYVNDMLPRQIKCKELIGAFIKRFNLYCTVDKDNDKKLIFTPRDEYYSGTTYVDWTDKIDLEKENSVHFLSELQNKRLIFTDKEDNDVYNTSYKTNVGWNYGAKIIEFENDFLKGDQIISSIFSPTPLIKNAFNLIVPAIAAGSPKCNIRLLYDGGNIDGQWTYKGDFGVLHSLSGYNYIGHFDNPTDPTLDISWGDNAYYYYAIDNYTTNNVYENYWRTYVDQIANGKLLTAYFYLDEKDISHIDFSKKIWIIDSFYYLNKIIDYNISSPTLTKCELIKIDHGLRNSARRVRGETTYRPQGDTYQTINVDGGVPGEQQPLSSGVLNKEGNNYITGGKAGIMLGEDNYIPSSSKSPIINSDNNSVINSENISILGGYGNNNVAGSIGSVIIGGSGNTITGNDNIIIGSVSKAISGSNEVWVNDLLFSGGTILNLNDLYIQTSSSYSATEYDNTIECRTSGITVTLPSVTTITGKKYRIINTSNWTVTANTTSSQTIGNATSGNPTYIQLYPQEWLDVISNGLIWRMI